MTWGGGVDFLKNLVTCLVSCDDAAENRVVVLLPVGHAAAEPPAFVHEFRRDLGDRVAVELIDGTPERLGAALAQHGVEVLLPAFQPLKGSHLPWVGYLYDFQHKYLPHLFSEQERLQREVGFFNMVDSASTVVVNSRAVAADVRRFYPHTAANIVSLPFSANAQEWWFATKGGAAQGYGIDRPYFIICNQFWVHKDHWTAFQAFAKVAAEHPDVALVCTGNTSDYRKPDYFPQLQVGVAALGLEKRIHFVGHVSKEAQIALLREAVALVQPTMFEGGPGGGAAYDAIALGVRALVSDIPINLELPADGVTFFKANDAEALAAAMAATLAAPVPPQAEPAMLMEQGRQRRRAYGNVLLAAARHAHERHARAA